MPKKQAFSFGIWCSVLHLNVSASTPRASRLAFFADNIKVDRALRFSFGTYRCIMVSFHSSTELMVLHCSLPAVAHSHMPSAGEGAARKFRRLRQRCHWWRRCLYLHGTESFSPPDSVLVPASAKAEEELRRSTPAENKSPQPTPAAAVCFSHSYLPKMIVRPKPEHFYPPIRGDLLL